MKRKEWTPEQDSQLTEMYGANTPVSAIAKLMGRSPSSVVNRASRLGIGDPERAQVALKRRDNSGRAYSAGRHRRQRGGCKAVPSKLTPAERAWWLAGWHDMDIEMGVSVIGEVAA